MITKEEVVRILEDSINAPSGSNSQPWRFEFSNNELKIIALPEKDHPILNYRNRGTWVAHGALIENIIISSKAHGYTPLFEIFPDKNNKNLTAVFKFEKSNPEEEPLFPYIAQRATNRKPYQKTRLTGDQKNKLLEVVPKMSGVEVKFVEEQELVKELAEASSASEIVTLENQTLHKLFFEEIVWSRKEEAKKGKGLYLKTMELKPPQELVLRLVKRWSVMNFLNKIGFARKIATDNAKAYSSCATMIGIVVSGEDQSFLDAGRVMERLWLQAAKMKLGLHLMSGTLFFYQVISAGEKKIFSEEHTRLITQAYQKIEQALGVKEGLIALLLRTGFTKEPSAYSTKKKPIIDFS